MYGGPQQLAFASAMVNLGLVKYKDLNGGTPNCVSFTPNVCDDFLLLGRPRLILRPLNQILLHLTNSNSTLTENEQTLNWHDSDHRSSSAAAYLSPVESQRPNWTTLVGQQVTKVLISPSTGSGALRNATGVQFGTAGGSRYVAYASKEVIVAAGAIGVSTSTHYHTI